MKKNDVSDSVDDIKKLSGAECSWPDCDLQQELFVTLMVIEKNDSGEEFEGEVNMTVPFCHHHGSLATQGLCYILKKGDEHFLQAPYTMVDIAERVFFALRSEEKNVRS